MSMDEQEETVISYGKRILCGQASENVGTYVRIIGKVEQSVEGSFFLRSETNPTAAVKVVIDGIFIDPEQMPIVEVYGHLNDDGTLSGEVVYPVTDFSLFSLPPFFFFHLFFLFSTDLRLYEDVLSRISEVPELI